MAAENDLGRDDIKKLVVRIAIPSMLAQFVSVLYSIVDRMYIGNIADVGDIALAGVGICGPIVTMISAFAAWIGNGGAPLLSIKSGEQNKEGASAILANCFVLLIGMAVCLTIGAYLCKDALLVWFGATERIFPYAETYMRIYLIGTVFAVLSLGLNQFIICQGFSNLGMVSVIIGAVLNIVLDPVFIFALHMGVAGAAVATVLSQMASCAFVLSFLFGKKVPVKISFGGYDRKLIQRILLVGFTPFIIIAVDNVMIISMNSVLQTYGGPGEGDMLITCATIAQSYLLLITSPMIGISGGTQAILSYNYGARCVNRVKDAERNILGVMLIFTTIMFLLSRFIPRYFVLLFTTDPQYIRFSVWSIRTYTLMIIPLSFQYVFVDGLTALECPKTGLALSVTRKSLFVISAAVLPSFFGAKAAFFAEPVADGISSVLSTVVFLLLINRHLDKRCRMDKKVFHRV